MLSSEQEEIFIDEMIRKIISKDTLLLHDMDILYVSKYQNVYFYPQIIFVLLYLCIRKCDKNDRREKCVVFIFL